MDQTLTVTLAAVEEDTAGFKHLEGGCFPRRRGPIVKCGTPMVIGVPQLWELGFVEAREADDTQAYLWCVFSFLGGVAAATYYGLDAVDNTYGEGETYHKSKKY